MYMYLCRFCPRPSVPWLRRPNSGSARTSPRLVREVLKELTEDRDGLAFKREFQDVFARCEFDFWGFHGAGARFSKRRKFWHKLVRLTKIRNMLVGLELSFSKKCKAG